MQNFEKNFEEFCKSPGMDSGKASSYVRAIRYLCEYMEIYEINEDAVRKMKSVEESLKDKRTPFYRGLLEFLCERRQSSYLKNGFICAALKYLFSFAKDRI